MSKTVDYSAWDRLARDEDAEEKQRKEREREERRMKHFLEQARAKKEHEQRAKADNEAKGIVARDHDHAHDHDHSHHHHHDGHDHSSHAANSSALAVSPVASDATGATIAAAPVASAFASAAPFSRPRCGCGYMSPEDIKALQNAPPVPEVPVAEKNAKKRAAIAAAREHGGQLFKAGDYRQALAVYERGVLIINGMFGISDEETDEMCVVETALDTNMAACCIKLEDFQKALDYAKMALRLDAGNLKAQYRMAQALAGMSDFAEAKRVCAAAVRSAAATDSANAIAADFRRLHADIARTDAERTATQRAFEQTMGRRMQEKLAAGSSGAGTASGAGSLVDTGTSGTGTSGTGTDADTSTGTGSSGTGAGVVSQTAEGSVVVSAVVTADETRP